ncbi:MAG: ABC transporter ATP-binding protein [Pseudomonadales bacterium]|nr:ABC transporter ATP-binding protein [Pseudomonadales bacterium]
MEQTNLAPALSVEELSVSFKQGKQITDAVKNVSFDLYKGETLALVGESGSGKSVTAHAITQLLPEKTVSYNSGSVNFNDKDLLKLNDQALREIRGNKIAMIFQEPMTALNPLHTVEKQIRESLFLHQNMNAQQARTRTIELLELVGLPDPASRLKSYPHELSGGQRQRVMIAMALANEPDILIADEPTTALDVTIQKQVLNLIKELQEKLGMAILLITHDLGVVKRYADRVAVMTQGELVETNQTESLFNSPQHEYTQKLLNAEPKGLPTELDENAEAILTTEQLKVWFPIKRGVFKHTVGHIKAVNDINIRLLRGHTLGVVGESGSGKTTLVQALLKLCHSEGGIVFRKHDLGRMSRRQIRPLRRQLQIVFQDPFSSLSPRMSIGEIIGEGLEIHKIGDQESQSKAIINAMEEVGLDPSTRHRYPHEFSGGQRQRIAIARALVLQPEVIILDEPTSALDRSVQAQVVDLLRSLQEKHGFSYIFISHDLKVVKALAHDVIVLRGGEVVESGHASEVYGNPQTEYTKELISAAFDL